jgi:hypothetical protein
MDFHKVSLLFLSLISHHYREECDADTTALLSHFDWRKSGLREEDEQ